MDLYEELRLLARALDDAGVAYALCGGLAMAIHGIPRATRDIDLLAQEADLERIRRVARDRGFTIEVLLMAFSSNGQSVQRFSKISASGSLMLDILFVNEGLGPVWDTRTQVEFEQGTLWVVSLQGLCELKLKAGRPQDIVDIQQLEVLRGS